MLCERQDRREDNIAAFLWQLISAECENWREKCSGVGYYATEEWMKNLKGKGLYHGS